MHPCSRRLITSHSAMITKEVINNIYKQCKSSRPKSPADLNLPLLFEYAIENHGIFFDEDNLIIESVGQSSPFYTLELSRILDILEFERHIAIVLPNAILFLNKADNGVHVHLREPSISLLDRIKNSFSSPEPEPDF